MRTIRLPQPTQSRPPRLINTTAFPMFRKRKKAVAAVSFLDDPDTAFGRRL
jgi:hypothetical protein